MVGVNKFRTDEMPNIEKIVENKPNDLEFELLTDLRLSSVFEK